MKKLSILGSTGSIGTQTLDIVPNIGASVCALTTNKNTILLEEQVRKFKPTLAVAYDEQAAKDLKIRLADTNVKVETGIDGLIHASTMDDCDMLVTAVVGMIGLLPTLSAIEKGIDIALANKETLVCAGHIVMRKAQEKNVNILPVDSEHSAIFQSMHGQDLSAINKIILTASGGPFFGKTLEEIYNATKVDALKHPNWDMGAKISIDSATMMNKGLEFIEAMWLYDIDPSKIDIVVHRQSIIHSLVEYNDNSIIAQLSTPDMRLPIQYAITYPKRFECNIPKLNLWEMSNLTFDKPDYNTFKALKLAISAAHKKGNSGAVLNGANEVAVELFLQDKIKFGNIPELVLEALENVSFKDDFSIDTVLESDKLSREIVYSKFK